MSVRAEPRKPFIGLLIRSFLSGEADLWSAAARRRFSCRQFIAGERCARERGQPCRMVPFGLAASPYRRDPSRRRKAVTSHRTPNGKPQTARNVQGVAFLRHWTLEFDIRYSERLRTASAFAAEPRLSRDVVPYASGSAIKNKKISRRLEA